MIDKFNIKTWRGLPRLWAFDRAGNCVFEEFEENLVVTSAQPVTCHALVGDSTNFITKIALGNDPTSPLLADSTVGGLATSALTLGDNMVSTTLVAFLTTITSFTYPSANSITFLWDVDFTEANGLSFAEIGLLSEGQTLFARKTRTPIIKDSSLRLHGEWTITLS